MMMKFWSENINLVSPSIIASETTEDANMMHVRLDINDFVRNLLGIRNLITMMLMKQAMKP